MFWLHYIKTEFTIDYKKQDCFVCPRLRLVSAILQADYSIDTSPVGHALHTLTTYRLSCTSINLMALRG